MFDLYTKVDKVFWQSSNEPSLLFRPRIGAGTTTIIKLKTALFLTDKQLTIIFTYYHKSCFFTKILFIWA